MRARSRRLTQLVRPHVAIVTTIAPAHLGNSLRSRRSPTQRPRFSSASSRRRGGHQPRQRVLRSAGRRARARGATSSASARARGRSPARDADLPMRRLARRGAAIVGEPVTLPARQRPARTWRMNSLAVLAAAELLGADLASATRGACDARARQGRGVRRTLRSCGRASFTLIDESYNANPPPCARRSRCSRQTRRRRGRRIAVLGDMLELGEQAPATPRRPCRPSRRRQVDLVFAWPGRSWPRSGEALPASRAGARLSRRARTSRCSQSIAPRRRRAWSRARSAAAWRRW